MVLFVKQITTFIATAEAGILKIYNCYKVRSICFAVDLLAEQIIIWPFTVKISFDLVRELAEDIKESFF
jgi:hypothetical protein